MSYQYRFTAKAEASLDEGLYHVLHITGNGPEVNRLYDQNDSTMCGVLQNNPGAAGRAAIVAYLGLSKIVAGGAISAGDVLTCNTSARAITVTSGDMAFGRAIEAAGADGEIIEAILFPPVRWGEVA